MLSGLTEPGLASPKEKQAALKSLVTSSRQEPRTAAAAAAAAEPVLPLLLLLPKPPKLLPLLLLAATASMREMEARGSLRQLLGSLPAASTAS
jgi:hypothetical protein